MIESQKLASSNIATVAYDPAAKELTVHFRNGQVYTYRDVDPATHRAFIDAPSPGAYLNRSIRGVFPHRKVS